MANQIPIYTYRNLIFFYEYFTTFTSLQHCAIMLKAKSIYILLMK